MNVLASLFVAAFAAATLLPAQSEILLAFILARGEGVVLPVAVATVGNVLGSSVNWALGRYLLRFSGRRWFPLKGAALDRTTGWYRRYGAWSLLLSWVPVIGDPLTLVAGVLRTPLPLFLMLVTLAKGARYVAVAVLMG
ncbi:YqaA family protein [Paenirhodobacter sp.]|uniref:YqaA family protein n=1 Tax=Paenirhodobacter sp. TaxID=1965326 RepID=UPI003B400A9F